MGPEDRRLNSKGPQVLYDDGTRGASGAGIEGIDFLLLKDGFDLRQLRRHIDVSRFMGFRRDDHLNSFFLAKAFKIVCQTLGQRPGAMEDEDLLIFSGQDEIDQFLRDDDVALGNVCLLYTSPSPRDS